MTDIEDRRTRAVVNCSGLHRRPVLVWQTGRASIDSCMAKARLTAGAYVEVELAVVLDRYP